jgi:signal transduction histidine kinase/CheY-like chemotaxis protein
MARVLIVDDDLVSLLYIEQIIKSFGHEIVGKEKSGPDGVAKAGLYKPDIVFMDISMPGEYDGIEAARLIENQFDIPVIFITSYEIDQFLNKVKEVGPFGYIMKPFKELEIKAAIYIALYRKDMEKKIKQALNNYKKSYHFQILISNLLVELNKSYDIYEKLDHQLEIIRKAMDIDSLFIYSVENTRLKKINHAIDTKYNKIEIFNNIDINEFLKNNKFTIDSLKIPYVFSDFKSFGSVLENHFKSINLKYLSSNPIYFDNKLYGLLFAANFNDNPFSTDVKRNIKIIAKALSLVFKRHFDILKINDIEKEKLIQEKINIRMERLATIGQLTSAITHEINQPLESIRLLSESPVFWSKENKEIPVEKMLENFSKISNRVKRIDDIITNLRLLIKTPEKIMIAPCNLNKIIFEIKSLIEAKLKAHCISMILELDEGIKDISVSNVMMHQVITDIIDNAVKIHDKTNNKNKEIIIKTFEESGNVILEISDNASGIKEEILDKIFEPFFSGDNEKAGMGLGLYIVYNILKTFGASISASNNKYGGATFTIKFNVV